MAPVLAFAAVLSTLAPAAAQDLDQEVRQLLDDGAKDYRAGKYDEAFVKFQEAFNKNPGNDVVYAWMRRVGEDLVASMINNPDPKIRETGKMIFRLAQPGQAIRRDAATLQTFLTDLGSTDSAVFLNAFWHLKNIGPYAVASLIPTLGQDTSDRLRPRVMMLLTEMHYDSELGVIEALHSENLLMRQNAAIVLGNIRAERALPYLKWMLENPNEQPEVKKVAHEAMTKITARSAAEWKSASEYFMELAEKYYYAHPTTVHRWAPNDLIWFWDGTAVQQRDVPAFAFNEQMAEEVLYDLLDLSENHAGAWSLMAANHFAQLLEAQDNLTAAQVALDLGDVEQAEIDALKGLLANVERAAVLGNMISRPYLYQALSRSLSDGRSDVAVAVLNALGQMAHPEDIPSAVAPSDPTRYGGALVGALTHEEKAVRYAAARVLTKLNPQFRTLGMDLVMPVMIDALGERGIRTVLLVQPTRTPAEFQRVNGWKALLRRLNTHVSAVGSIPEGMQKMTSFPREDIVFVAFELAHTVTFAEHVTRQQVEERFYSWMKRDVRTREVPVVIVCANAEEQAQAQQIYQDAAAVILASAPSTEIETVLNGLYDAMGDTAKARADAVAQWAAETLASLDADNSMYPYLQARDALMGAAGVANKRVDAVRRPAIHALGNFGDPAALDVLADALNEKGDAKETRVACAWAMGEILRRSMAAPTEKTFTVLRENLMDGDLDVELAVGHALGNAKLSLEQRRDLEKFKRIQRGTGQ